MVPDKVQTEILQIVCSRFLNLQQSTPRRSLVVKFHNPDTIDVMVSDGLLRQIGSGVRGEEQYLPNAATFALSGDANCVGLAKTGVAVVLHVLKNMYEVEFSKTDFTFADLVDHTKKIYDSVDEDSLRLGMYLSRDFPVFDSYGSQEGSTEMTRFQISESIMKISLPEAHWDKFVGDYLNRKSISCFSVEQVPPPGTGYSETLEISSSGDDRFDWGLIHEMVRGVAESRFRSGHYADSVEAALKSVNQRVHEIVKAELNLEMDGSQLMNKAFSKDSPVIKIGNLETMSGRNRQVGYMQIFAGAMTGIRNPKAHGNVTIDAAEATHLLFLASILMFVIDDAEIVHTKMGS